MRVLIADDNSEILKCLEGILTKLEGIEIVGKAKNGEEELELIRRLKPDIVLTDNDMPKYKGIEVVEIIRNESNDYEPIFIMITGDISNELIIKIRECNINLLIRKPINEEKLIDELKRVMQEDEKIINDFQDNKKISIFSKFISKFK